VDGARLAVTADRIAVAEDFIVGGNLLLASGQVDFEPTSASDLLIQAGEDHSNEVAFIALGADLATQTPLVEGHPEAQTLFSWEGITAEGNGNISALQSGLLTVTAGKVDFLAAGALENQTTMVMDLQGGPVSVALGDTTAQESFNVRSYAGAALEPLTQTNLVDSVATLLGITNINTAFQESRPQFPNPTAFLSMLEASSFIDASLFEEDLSLFGVIGNGIAMSLNQCEEAEGCAPTVTEEELEGFIAVLQERISRLEALIAQGEMAQAEGQTLLAGYRNQLQNFLQYQAQLRAFVEARESDEFGGDDFGDEFEDVFEAEETLDLPSDSLEQEAAPAELEMNSPADGDGATERESDAEEEDDFDESRFEDLEENSESFDSSPPPYDATPTAPGEMSEDVDDLDSEFEELDDELEDMLLNQLFRPGNVKQLAGSIRIGDDGTVVWTGDLLLPTMHRRF
jgi:hypothetical protein